MITTPTTFIIGAGASRPYNLPLGSGLLAQAQAVTRESDVGALLVSSGLQLPEVLGFVGRIQNHSARSIDAFLEKHHSDESTMNVGRAMIAALMAKARAQQRPPRSDEDWLGEIVEYMSRSARNRAQFDEGNASVRFVTFNFDSIIEERLEAEMRNMFITSPEDGNKSITDTVRVVHVHGRLPPAPEVRDQAAGSLFKESRNGQIAPEWVEWMKRATRNVNVVTDEIDEGTVATAREYISGAKIVCFLGFSYHSDNLVRLDLANTIRNDTHHHVFGSAFLEPEGRRGWIQTRIPSIHLGGQGDDCLKTLRRFNVFVD